VNRASNKRSNSDWLVNNLPPEKWTSAELNTMIQGYKRPSDSAIPPKKCDKLARYREICGRADPQSPQPPTEFTAASLLLPPLPPLPPLPLAQEEAMQRETIPTAASAQSNEVTAITEPLILDAADGELAVTSNADITLAEAMDDVLMEDLLPMVLGCEV